MNEPSISTVGEIVPFATSCIYSEEWNFFNYKLFPKSIKEQIKTILLLSLFNQTTREPLHPQSYLFKLPRDIKYEIFKFIASLPHQLMKKRKRQK